MPVRHIASRAGRLVLQAAGRTDKALEYDGGGDQQHENTPGLNFGQYPLFDLNHYTFGNGKDKSWGGGRQIGHRLVHDSLEEVGQNDNTGAGHTGYLNVLVLEEIRHFSHKRSLPTNPVCQRLSARVPIR